LEVTLKQSFTTLGDKGKVSTRGGSHGKGGNQGSRRTAYMSIPKTENSKFDDPMGIEEHNSQPCGIQVL
jgi:hypothetical protein